MVSRSLTKSHDENSIQEDASAVHALQEPLPKFVAQTTQLTHSSVHLELIRRQVFSSHALKKLLSMASATMVCGIREVECADSDDDIGHHAQHALEVV